MIDQDLLTELQYALLEPPDGGQSWPSLVWDREEAIDALNTGERDLLRRTHLLVTRTEIATGQVDMVLPFDWLATAHLVWREDATQTRTPLAPTDVTEANLGLPNWRDGDRPIAYQDSGGEQLTVRLVPTAVENGVMEVFYVRVPTPVNGNGRSFTVPDDYLSAVKYGALDMLLGKVGRLQDPERALYCRKRVDLMVAATEIILGGWA